MIENKASLDEAAARVRLSEQMHATAQQRIVTIEKELRDTQVALVDAHQQLELHLSEKNDMASALTEIQKNADEAIEHEMQAYERVKESIELLEQAHLERDQASKP